MHYFGVRLLYTRLSLHQFNYSLNINDEAELDSSGNSNTSNLYACRPLLVIYSNFVRRLNAIPFVPAGV